MVNARETERHYEVTNRVMDSKGIWIEFMIKAILHYTKDGKTTLSLMPTKGDKFWFDHSDPVIVEAIASMMVEVAKDAKEKR